MIVNSEIRVKILTTGVKQWQIAEKMGIADTSLSRKLRYELSENEKIKILAIIDELAKKETAWGAGTPQTAKQKQSTH